MAASDMPDMVMAIVSLTALPFQENHQGSRIVCNGVKFHCP